MGKKAKQKQQRKAGKTFNLFHFTEEAYLQIFHEATTADYEAYIALPEAQQIKEEEKNTGEYIATIRHIAFGDDYFTWLSANELENTYEQRVAYANQLSDAKVHTLWKAYQEEKETRFIPFIAMNERTTLEDTAIVTKDYVNQATDILAKSFQLAPEVISVHPKLLRHEEAVQVMKVAPSVSVIKENETCLVRFLAVAASDMRPAIQTRKEWERGRWSEQKVPNISLTAWAENVWAGMPKGTEVLAIPGLLTAKQTKSFTDTFQTNMKQLHV